MAHYIRISIVLLFSMSIVCVDQTTTPTVVHDYPGMIRVASKNCRFTQGSFDPWAASDEKPPLTIDFSYNFWIDTTEVTLQEYWSSTGRLPSECNRNDTTSRKPVHYVTWYDAILFCNEKSRKNGLDTIYSYTSVTRGSDGKVVSLSGLREDLTRWGYRLPTEAEWEYAASGGSGAIFPWGNEPDSTKAEKIAWYERNAGAATHLVGTRSSNRFGLYDMFGNVMEWVNDYKGTYQNDSLQNFAGSLQSDLEERPVKGGSFLNSIEKLRRSCRSDVYSTTAATSTRYIGFRCCVGAIPGPQYLFPGGISGNVNQVECSVSSLEPITGTRNARLVFVNKVGSARYLCYVDFSEARPRVYQFFDLNKVYFPTISPDGKWVAFSTQDEGMRSGSDIYIRRLDRQGSALALLGDNPGFIPRWWVDPSTLDTFIVYSNSAVINTLADWATSATKMQKIANGKPIGSPIVLDAQGSFHGGLSGDRRYMATGYQLLKMKDRTTGELRTLFTSPQNGKTGNDTSQVCNVSITPDIVNSDRVLFLDFGSGRGASTITQSTYGIHEIVFMCNFDGTVVNWYRCPSGYKEWDHPEWSNDSRFAIVSAKPLSDPTNRNDLFVLDLEHSRYEKIIHGTDLWHPWLWVSQTTSRGSPSLSLDSAGFYNEPASHYYQSELARKFPDFWKSKDSIDILFLGSSYIQNGAAPSVFEPLYGYNMGFAAGGLLGIKKLMYDYALTHCSKLKVIVISLNIGWFNLAGGDCSWMSGFENTKGYTYDKQHDFWKNGIPSNFIEAVNAAPNPYDPVTAENRGWYPAESEGWGPNPPDIPDAWKWELNDNYFTNIKTLSEMVSDIESRDILLVGVLFPQSPHFKNTPVYGSSGPLWETSQKIISQIQSLDTNNEHFILYDAYNNGDNDYVSDDFQNAAHLSKSGGLKVSARIDSLVDGFLVNQSGDNYAGF